MTAAPVRRQRRMLKLRTKAGQLEQARTASAQVPGLSRALPPSPPASRPPSFVFHPLLLPIRSPPSTEPTVVATTTARFACHA